MKTITVLLDGQLISVESPTTLEDLLSAAGKPLDGSVGVVVDNNIYDHLNDEIPVQNGDKLETKAIGPVLIRYEVNGEELVTTDKSMSVAEILEAAGEKAGIDPNDLQNYYLEDLERGIKYDDLAKPVQLSDGDKFLALHVGPTPVASGMAAIDKALLEFRDLGIDAGVVTGVPHGPVLVFVHRVKNGPRKGECYKIGISFQEDSYPEYPPHFVHVAELNGSKLTRHAQYTAEGVSWMAFSVPPSDFWDRLPGHMKNMKTYLGTHLERFWRDV